MNPYSQDPPRTKDVTNPGIPQFNLRPKVTDQLMTRLEKFAPPGLEVNSTTIDPLTGAPIPRPMNTNSLKEANDKLKKEMEATLKKYEEDLHGKEKKEPVIDVNKEPEADPVCNDKVAAQSFYELKAIVEDFNKRLEVWHKNRGCVANFNWAYNPTKKLEIAGIDCIIYRKPPPSSKTVKEIVEQGPPEK